jgi:hypothetical protein
MDIYQNNGNFDELNIHEGEIYFDLTNKIDLKTYTQPVLISSTINLNSLAAVRKFIQSKNKNTFFFKILFLVIQSK